MLRVILLVRTGLELATRVPRPIVYYIYIYIYIYVYIFIVLYLYVIRSSCSCYIVINVIKSKIIILYILL